MLEAGRDRMVADRRRAGSGEGERYHQCGREKAYENYQPFPMVTAWREFSFNLELIAKRRVSYEVVAHSRSAARSYPFRALWLFRRQGTRL
jgi:hypothetical protein